MGFNSSDPQITTINPNTGPVQQTSSAAGNFFTDLFSQPNPFAANPGSNAVASTLGQNPQGQAVQALSSILGGNAGQQVVDAAQPVFNQNLQNALGMLNSSSPGRFSTAANQQGVGLAQQALQDFNLFSAQALQQGQDQQIAAAAGILNPFTSILGLGTGFAQPAPLESVVQPGGGGFGGFLGGLAGTALGSFAGPLGSTLGGRLGSSLFGGGKPGGGAFTSVNNKAPGVGSFIPGFGGLR